MGAFEGHPRSVAEARLLAAGVELVQERGAGSGVLVRLSEAAERAGLTTGGGYRAWNNQDEFRLAVAKEFMRNCYDAEPHALREGAQLLMAAGVSFHDLVRLVASQALNRILEDEKVNSILFSLYGASFVSESLRQAIRELYQRIIGDYIEMYTHIFEHYGHQLRPGLRLEDFAVSLSALMEGFTLHSLISDEVRSAKITRPRGGSKEESWPLFAAMTMAIIEAFVEPIPDGTNDTTGKAC